MNLVSCNIELQGSTVHYLELLCSEYNLTDDEVISHGLRLLELDLAEFEARRIVAYRGDSNEA